VAQASGAAARAIELLASSRGTLVREKTYPAERLEMFNLSAAMGQTFAQIAREVTERVSALGPSALNHGNKEAGDDSSIEKKHWRA
jgi:coenzyme F420-reducing hydrogenase delta subunit